MNDLHARCDWRAIYGLSGLAVLLWLSLSLEVAGIEADSNRGRDSNGRTARLRLWTQFSYASCHNAPRN